MTRYTYHRLQYENSTILLSKLWEEHYMDASAINRKLKELDALEKRLRQTVNPSQILLKQVQEERNALLNPQEKK